MLVAFDHALRIHRPRDDDPIFGIQPQQPLDPIALGLELEEHVRLRGEKRDHFSGKADIGIQGEAVRDFPGADAKEKTAMAAE